MTENIEQSGWREKGAPANATLFKFPSGTAPFLLIVSILCFCLLILVVYQQISHPKRGSLGIATVCVAMFAAFGLIAFRSSGRLADGKGNVWAAVIINRQNGKPIKLFRFREGSIALRDALQSAWKAAVDRTN